jgi:hypothetical protein
VYQDNTLQAAHPRPILTDGQGMVPPIYVGKGDYKFRLLTSGYVLISEVDGLPGAVSSTNVPDPGETYPLTDPTSVLITGDIVAAYRTGSRAGFARCNGNTVGNASSGASEIAVGLPSNQEQPVGSAYKLFVHLWESDSSLPVYSAGVQISRGSTAIADWDANRQLGLPDLRGRTPVGLDGMGGPDAGRIQLLRQITATTGSTLSFVPSFRGLTVGTAIVGPGIQAGTTISDIEGDKVTLSLPALSSSSQMVRFSQFSDARVLGASTGASAYELTYKQVGQHSHGATSYSSTSGHHGHAATVEYAGEHTHTYSYGMIDGGMQLTQPGNSSYNLHSGITSLSGNHTHAITISGSGAHEHPITTTIHPGGDGHSYSAMQPSILLAFYIKL